MELKLLQLKLFFAKVVAFFKEHWLDFVFGVILLYAIVVVKQKQDQINKMLEEQNETRDANRQNIDELVNRIEQEIAKRRKVESDFQELIKKINERHNEELKRIASVKQEEIKQLIERHQNDPVRMAQTLNELFGIQIM